MDTYISERYFNWLRSEVFTTASDRKTYEGVLRTLHDIPFIWLIPSDDNRAGDALTFRQYEFLDLIDIPKDVDQVMLGQWATATPSVLEVLLGCARRWCYYFGEGSVAYYFGHMFRNMGFDRYTGQHLTPANQARVRTMTDEWLQRRFMPNGFGSPWPLNQGFDPTDDQRCVDMWGQMNAYSAEHFQ